MRSGHSAGERTSPRPLRWLIAIVAIMAALTVGWPLASRAVSDDRPVVPGQSLTIGPDSTHSALFTPGRTWLVRSGESDQHEDWSLVDGPVDVSVIYVTLLGPSQAARLWSGLAAALRVGDRSATEGGPATVISAAGDQGQTGAITGNGWAGQAAVFPSPGDDFAVELVSIDRAPGSAPGRAPDRAAAAAATALLARSLRFPWGSQ